MAKLEFEKEDFEAIKERKKEQSKAVKSQVAETELEFNKQKAIKKEIETTVRAQRKALQKKYALLQDMEKVRKQKQDEMERLNVQVETKTAMLVELVAKIEGVKKQWK